MNACLHKRTDKVVYIMIYIYLPVDLMHAAETDTHPKLVAMEMSQFLVLK